MIPSVRTGYLEVHISEEVLQTLDICQNDVIVISITGYQTTGNTCNHALIGTPAAIKDMQDAQVDAMEVEPFDSNVSDTVRIAYGNSSSDGSTGIKCSLSQCSVTDLTASRSSGWFGLAYRIGREVVLMHVSLGS